jgi:hypothetical protein
MATPTLDRQRSSSHSAGARHHRHSRSRWRRKRFGWKEAVLVSLMATALGAAIFSLGFLLFD